MPTIDEVRFPGVPTSVQDMWKHIIRANMACLNSSETCTELSDKLYGLKIEGIGDESIRRTIEGFLKHNDNIVLEDNCFQFLLSHNAKMFLKEQDIVDLNGLW